MRWSGPPLPAERRARYRQDSSLRGDLQRGARALIRVAWGRCWEGGGAPAYWPFIQILRACIDDRDGEQLKALLGSGASEIARLIPEIKLSLPSLEDAKATTDSEAARFLLFDAVATLFRNLARIQPLMIVIDDLHDADQPSLQKRRNGELAPVRQFTGALMSFRAILIREVRLDPNLTSGSLAEDTDFCWQLPAEQCC